MYLFSTPDNETLLNLYNLKTLHPVKKEDLAIETNNGYPEDIRALSVEEQFDLLSKVLKSNEYELSSTKLDLNKISEDDAQDPLKGKGSNVISSLIKKGIVSTPNDPIIRNYLIGSQNFNSFKYLTTIHKDSSLNELNQSLNFLEKNILAYKQDLKQAIEFNFLQFLDCKTKIDNALNEFLNSKSKAQQDRDNSKYFNPQKHKTKLNGNELSSELESSLNYLTTTTSLLIRPINENKAKEEKIYKMIEFIKSNEFFFNLPSKLIHHLSVNNNIQFIDDYIKYIDEKGNFLKHLDRKYNDMKNKYTQEKNNKGLQSIGDEKKMKLTIINIVFKEIDQLASQYRDKIYKELLSLDHEVSSDNGTNSKFISLVNNLSKLDHDQKINPIADFLTKQITVIDEDFEYQVGKFDNKFLIMQNKLIEYMSSLNVEQRNGSHVNYIKDKYENYKEDIKQATQEEKLSIIKECFESDDLLDLSLINESWLILYNFINYIDNLLLKNSFKFLNNYSHYIKMGIDNDGKIRESFLKFINQVVLVLGTLFDDENEGNNNQLESSPKNYKQFLPYYTNSLSTMYHLGNVQVKVNNIMTKLGEIVGKIGNVSKFEDTNKQIKNLKASSLKINQKILEAVCSTWVNDCMQFYELEDWNIEETHNGGSSTKLIKIIEYYQLYIIMKLSNLVKPKNSSEFKIVRSYPSKRMLVSIEIQFMRSLNIIVDSLMKKYNNERNETSSTLEVFKILTMNNFDKLSRIIYPRLIAQFDKNFEKELSRQNLKLFSDIDKASLTIIDDILNNEKLYISTNVNQFFNKDYEINAIKVDSFIFEILIHFVKLVNIFKPLTSEEIFITIINELQIQLIKTMLDNLRADFKFTNPFVLINLKLDTNFLLQVFDKSKLLQINDSCYKFLQLLLNEIENKFNEFEPRINYNKSDFDIILEENLEFSRNQFSCF
ncbi:unnamed protein product [Candida verbasci]|uniref:Exocyst complex component SEC5 n=1 Tax=Candida verbasci TaxID=1227364 RepID=A0A9W4U0D2_9ASCO|nr:unnamed protein product [Candida verbasci]